MKKVMLSFMIFFLLNCVCYADEPGLIKLKGISAGMKKNKLLDSWGYPAKRDPKNRHKETWFYYDAQTPNPTDGIVVEFFRGKVKSWRAADNIYKEMSIWGAGEGEPG